MFTLKVDTESGKYIHVVYSVYDFPYKTALPDALEGSSSGKFFHDV